MYTRKKMLWFNSIYYSSTYRYKTFVFLFSPNVYTNINQKRFKNIKYDTKIQSEKSWMLITTVEQEIEIS